MLENLDKVRSEIAKRELELSHLRDEEEQLVKAYKEERNSLATRLRQAAVGSMVFCGDYLFVKRMFERGIKDWAWIYAARLPVQHNYSSANGSVADEILSVGEKNCTFYLM